MNEKYIACGFELAPALQSWLNMTLSTEVKISFIISALLLVPFVRRGHLLKSITQLGFSLRWSHRFNGTQKSLNTYINQMFYQLVDSLLDDPPSLLQFPLRAIKIQ